MSFYSGWSPYGGDGGYSYGYDGRDDGFFDFDPGYPEQRDYPYYDDDDDDGPYGGGFVFDPEETPRMVRNEDGLNDYWPPRPSRRPDPPLIRSGDRVDMATASGAMSPPLGDITTKARLGDITTKARLGEVTMKETKDEDGDGDGTDIVVATMTMTTTMMILDTAITVPVIAMAMIVNAIMVMVADMDTDTGTTMTSTTLATIIRTGTGTDSSGMTGTSETVSSIRSGDF